MEIRMQQFTILFFGLLPIFSLAQSASLPIKNWLSTGVQFPVANDFSLDLSQMYGLNIAPYSVKYLQSTAKINYSPGKRFEYSIGYMLTTSLGKESPDARRNRFFSTVGVKSKLAVWRISNALRFEVHDPREKRYDYRMIYIFNIRPRTDWIAPKIKLAPFFNGQLFYNIGGKPISQYDAAGNKIGEFAPEGIHRFRIKTGFSMNPVKVLKLTFYGMYQEEFNTILNLNNHTEINVTNPKTGNISRKFENYMVFGASAKLYIPKKKKPSKQKNNVPKKETMDFDNE